MGGGSLAFPPPTKSGEGDRPPVRAKRSRRINSAVKGAPSVSLRSTPPPHCVRGRKIYLSPGR